MLYSIIIPLYNKAHTIKETLDHVINQTVSDYEIVIVNDGSTDNSLQILSQYEGYKNIRVISQANAGVSVARNTGIKEAKGDWLCFLDADDLWDIKYLERVKFAIENNPNSKYILVGRKVVNISDGSVVQFIPDKYNGKIEGIKFFENPHVYSHISASVINRNLLLKEKIEFIEGQRCNEDYTFLFKVAMKTEVTYIGLPLMTYRGGIEGQATSTLNSETRLKDGVLFRNSVYEYWIQQRDSGLRNAELKLFPIFMRYETLHQIQDFIKNNDYNSIKKFFSLLSKGYKRLILHHFEETVMKAKSVKLFSYYWIMANKILWRMRRYPRVNTKLKIQ